MSLINTLRILLLKRRARAAYYRAQRPDYLDCGNAMADHISGGRMSAAKAEFDLIVAELRRIDPDAPASKQTT